MAIASHSPSTATAHQNHPLTRIHVQQYALDAKSAANIASTAPNRAVVGQFHE